MLPSYTRVESKKDSTGYTPDPATEYLVTQYADAPAVHGTFYTITNDTTLIIIGRGAGQTTPPPYARLIAAHGNHVNAWILSHPHQDHAGAFNRSTPHRTASRSTPSTTTVSTMTLSKRPESRTMTLR